MLDVNNTLEIERKKFGLDFRDKVTKKIKEQVSGLLTMMQQHVFF